MKKILIYNGQLFMGGIERVLITYLRALAQDRELDITLLIKENDSVKNVFASEVPENIKVEYIKTESEVKRREEISSKKSNPLFRLYYQLYIFLERVKMKRFLQGFFSKNKFDAVIDFDMSLGKYLSVVPDEKIGWSHFSLAAKKGKKRERFRKRLAKYDKLVVICDEMKKEMEEVYPEFISKTVRIYNPMDIDGIRELGMRQDVLSQEEQELLKTPYMVGVSRLVKGKGREDLVEIYSELKKRGIKEKLYILGEGPEYENLKELIKTYKLEENVYLLGQKQNPYIWMRGAELFLHPSYGEGLAMVLVESMINGAVPVAYDCPVGPAEVLGNGKYGSIIEIGDKKSFENSVYELLTDLELRKRYKDRFQEQLSNFDRKNIVEQVKNIF